MSALRCGLVRAVDVLMVGVSGAVVATGLVGVTALVGWWGLVALMGATAVYRYICRAWSRRVAADHPSPVVGVGSAPALAVLILSWVGLTHLLGPALALCVGVLWVAGPWLRRRARNLLTRMKPDVRTVAAPPADSGQRAAIAESDLDGLDACFLTVPDSLSDEDLCAAWRSSYVALQRASSITARLRTVEIRALYLDLLERRLGEDFTRWMSSNPRPAGAPSLATDQRTEPG
jgi:hypothetical protein